MAHTHCQARLQKFTKRKCKLQGAYEPIRTGILEPWGTEPERNHLENNPVGIEPVSECETNQLSFAPAGGHCFWACVPYRLNPGISKTFAFRSLTHSAFYSGKPWALQRFRCWPRSKSAHCNSCFIWQQFSEQEIIPSWGLTASVPRQKKYNVKVRLKEHVQNNRQAPLSIFCNAEPPTFTGLDFLDGNMDGCLHFRPRKSTSIPKGIHDLSSFQTDASPFRSNHILSAPQRGAATDLNCSHRKRLTSSPMQTSTPK